MRTLQCLMPKSMGGQVVAILVVALLLSQALALSIYFVLVPERDALQRPRSTAARIATVVQVIEALPPNQRGQVAEAAEVKGLRFVYEEHSPKPIANARKHQASNVIEWIAADTGRKPDDIAVLTDRSDSDGPIGMAISLRGGGFLVAEASLGAPHRFGVLQQIAAFAFLFLSIGCLSIWLTRWVTLPLARFASAAERFGTFGEAISLPEQGPIEIRRAAQMFNMMQRRLHRLIDSQTRMLTAISHDLRTPLTRVRLRLELLPGSSSQRKILQDLAKMEQMLGSTISFLRDQQDSEAWETADIASMLQSLSDEFSDIGTHMTYAGPAHCPMLCRPQALERGFSNLLDNAAKFGTEIKVTLVMMDACVVVDVEDDGPGISEGDKEKVFEPFFCSDPARHDGQSGVGLGLSIADAVVRGHSGSIELIDRAPHGLIVRVTLPVLRHPATST